MRKDWIESILVIVLAALGLADAWRLSGAIRPAGTFHDVIGPDRYLGFISVGLLLCGIGYLTARSKTPGPPHTRGEKSEMSRLSPVVRVVSLLVAYLFAFPILGYLPATVIFFPFLYFMFGVRPWPKSVVVGLITTALFYAIFAYLAEMPLPKGLLENVL
jgi:hypothetical protein